LDALGLNLGYLLVQILNFIVILILLRAWVYKPVLNMLENRREKIAQGLEDARVAEEARENAEAEAEEVLEEARTEANGIIRQARQRAEDAAEEIKAEAQEDAQQAREEVLAEAEQERNQLLSDMRSQVGSLAIAAAQKLIAEALDEKRQRRLIDEFFSSVRAGKVVVLEGKQLAGHSANVTSALPLSEDEKNTIKQDIQDRMEGDVEVSFDVDPEILGGIIIRAGDKVFDNSVAGQLSDMQSRLD